MVKNELSVCPGPRWENLQRSLDPLAELGERKGKREEGRWKGGGRGRKQR